jgi:hypothetical protein
MYTPFDTSNVAPIAGNTQHSPACACSGYSFAGTSALIRSITYNLLITIESQLEYQLRRQLEDLIVECGGSDASSFLTIAYWWQSGALQRTYTSRSTHIYGSEGSAPRSSNLEN